jgi:hypothetical protein
LEWIFYFGKIDCVLCDDEFYCCRRRASGRSGQHADEESSQSNIRHTLYILYLLLPCQNRQIDSQPFNQTVEKASSLYIIGIGTINLS